MSEEGICYRPSSAERWMNCGASELLIMGTKAKNPDNEAAKRGREIHDEIAYFLETELKNLKNLNNLKNPENLSQDSKEIFFILRKYFIEFCKKFMYSDENNFTLIIENEVKLSPYINKLYGHDVDYFNRNKQYIIKGTPDLVFTFSNLYGGNFKRCGRPMKWENIGTVPYIELGFESFYIFDYKTGNKKCYANSWQMKLYALMYSKFARRREGIPADIRQEDSPSFKEIKTIIIQPSINWTDEHSFTMQELEEIEKQLLNQINNPTFKMGEWCQYCPAQKYCPIFARKINQSLCNLSDVDNLSNEKKVEILKYRKLINKTLDRIEEDVYNTLKSGNKMDGVSLTPKTGRRYINDEKRVKNYLINRGYKLEEIINFKLKSLSELSNLSEHIKKYILENSEIRSSGSKLKFGKSENDELSEAFVNLLNKE